LLAQQLLELRRSPRLNATFQGGIILNYDQECNMNWDRVEGNWKQVSGKIKQQWGKLTDDSLTQIDGKRDELVGKIQEAYGITRDDADRQVKDWESLNQ
jgi:uncharacterized protein YjbJ (UPF0337 family)